MIPDDIGAVHRLFHIYARSRRCVNECAKKNGARNYSGYLHVIAYVIILDGECRTFRHNWANFCEFFSVYVPYKRMVTIKIWQLFNIVCPALNLARLEYFVNTTACRPVLCSCSRKKWKNLSFYWHQFIK